MVHELFSCFQNKKFIHEAILSLFILFVNYFILFKLKNLSKDNLFQKDKKLKGILIREQTPLKSTFLKYLF